ncbi:unnamed protein product [Sphagnum troendelagicum]|uniref:Uncharacterized protein n=1 Tax=Sphagnum troendelagicum TaxID=128251 RepID=A0ABP0V3E8_9BRYO
MRGRGKDCIGSTREKGGFPVTSAALIVAHAEMFGWMIVKGSLGGESLEWKEKREIFALAEQRIRWRKADPLCLLERGIKRRHRR